jgi:hypothetical protein
MSAADKAKLDGLVDHDGASEIGADLADGDTILVSDVSRSEVRKSLFSRVWTYIHGKLADTPLTALAVGSDVTTSNATVNAPGLLPKLPADDASSKYLCGDGSWQVPAGSADFTGTDGSVAGASGLVPAPATSDANKFLNADGTWKSVEAAAAEDVAEEILALPRRDVLWVPAGAITPNTTNGAVAEVLSRAANLMSADTIRFAPSADTFADFDVVFPDDWDGNALKLKFYWTPRSSNGTAGQVVRLCAKARFFTDGGAITDGASSWQSVDDALVAYDYEHVTSAMSLAVDGSYVAGKRVHFWIKRNGANSADTLNEDASLLGVAVQFVRVGSPEAW